MFLFDIALHVLLVYTVLLIMFVTYASDEIITRVNRMIMAKLPKDPIVIHTLTPDTVNKFIDLGVPSNCQQEINTFVIMVALAIWFVLAVFVLCALIISDINREEFNNILVHNAIVFLFVCCVEFLFFKFIILKYAPINHSDMSTAINQAIDVAL